MRGSAIRGTSPMRIALAGDRYAPNEPASSTCAMSSRRGAELAQQDLPARGDRRLGELQLAHVALGEEDRRGGVVPRGWSTKTRSLPTIVSRCARPGGDRGRGLGVDEAAGVVEQAGLTSSATQSTSPEPHMPDGLRVADHLERPCSSPAIFTPSIAPSAARIPQRICAASNAGPGGRGRGEHALLVAQRDLAVGAHVDEQPQALVARQPRGEQAGDDVAADVGAERGEHEGGRARVHAHAEVGRRGRRRARAWRPRTAPWRAARGRCRARAASSSRCRTA